VIPAFAADQAAHTVTTQLGDGLTLTQLNSLTGSTQTPTWFGIALD
jgi:hypothetical protein